MTDDAGRSRASGCSSAAWHRGTREMDLLLGPVRRRPSGSRSIADSCRRLRRVAGGERPGYLRLGHRPGAVPVRRFRRPAHCGLSRSSIAAIHRERSSLCHSGARPAPGRRRARRRRRAAARAPGARCAPGGVLHVARDDLRMARTGRDAGLLRAGPDGHLRSRPGTACPTTGSRRTATSWRGASMP